MTQLKQLVENRRQALRGPWRGRDGIGMYLSTRWVVTVDTSTVDCTEDWRITRYLYLPRYLGN